MYVRWLGAFGKKGTLHDAFLFELSRTSPVACEKIRGKGTGKSYVDHARIGLALDPQAVYKRFKGDVWSLYNDKGQLYQTRYDYDAPCKQWECWAEPQYTAIVISNGSFATLSANAKETIREIVSLYNLPVYRLAKGKLIEEVVL